MTHQLPVQQSSKWLCLTTLLAIFLLSSQEGAAIEAHMQMKGPFQTFTEVNRECVSCHNQEAANLKKDIHWLWQRPKKVNGKVESFGKKTSLSHFAIVASLNKKMCMECHVSDNPQQFDFENKNNSLIDCLICHDTTNTYKRSISSKIGPEINLSDIIKNIGEPNSDNCLSCHFTRCRNPLNSGPVQISDVNHLANQSDIHLISKKINFSCLDCHSSGKNHTFEPTKSNNDLSRIDIGCSKCHSNLPHTNSQLNSHNSTIACQTCHIPLYAINTPAVISWNWSMAGKTSTISRQSPTEDISYLDENGYFQGSNIIPAYRWDNGNDQIYKRGGRVNPDQVTPLSMPANKKTGSILAPFSTTYGTQLYDKKYRYLISPLFNNDQENAFNASDWDMIAKTGMKAILLPYSGTHELTTTVTYKPLNHGVTSAKNALDCLDCHGKSGRIQWQLLGYTIDPWDQSSKKAVDQNNIEHLQPQLPQTIEETILKTTPTMR